MWCDVKWCDVMWCDLMWCDVMWCDAMRCDFIWCDVMWYNAMCYEVTRRDATQFNALHCVAFVFIFTFVVVSYGPAPLLLQLGLDTERIIVPASSKGVNNMADITDVSNIRHSFKTNDRRTSLYHLANCGDDTIGRELDLNEKCLVGSGSRIHNLLNSWTKVEKD